jgi:menaquinone-specific isochorismate synthase
MTVSPCLADFSVYNRELYQFLLEQERHCLKSKCAQIISIALEIDLVDPLVVLAKLAQPNQLNFYWENKSKKEAIAALGSVEKLEINGKDRFIESQTFIQNCLHRITSFSQTNQPFSRPLFFCGFSFFHENNGSPQPFPAATVFLPQLQVAVKNDLCVLVANITIDSTINIQEILQTLWKKVEIINSLEKNSLRFDYTPSKFSKKSLANPEKFKLSVLSAVETIRSSHLSKMVLADVLDIKSNGRFNLFQSLNNLRQLHPNCYIFSLNNGKGQNFIGASPERLINIQNQQLIADALAGSAPRGKNATEDTVEANRLINSHKERHEHLLVIDFITQSLSQLGLLPQVLAPRLRQLSNIQHLWTPISAIVPTNVHPLKIVAQLHPTPAVAGVARDVACHEIRRYESFERGLYAAPLGWVDSNNNCEFIVGIRSALIDGDRARLYAGAGIVAGSDPDKELAEIQLKLQALLRALV